MDQPVKFRNGKVAKNPFAIASLTNCQSNPDGTLHDNELNWLVRRARGGYGIINTCCVHVQANGKGWEGELGCFSDEQIPGYQRLVRAIKDVDPQTLLIVQVFHAGMRADETLIEGLPRSSVDTVYNHRAGVRKCSGLTEPEVETLIEDFIKACKRCQEAGCDGVELHGAHGYIMTQFLCPDLNQRTDQWGGKSLENRARMMRRVMQGAREACGPDFIIGMRLSPEPGYEKAGWNMDPDENIQVAKWLAEDGVDFISVSLMVRHSPTHITPKHTKTQGDAAKPLAQVFREALPEDVVVMCCGGVKSAADVQTLIDMGVNVAVTGKTAIGTPNFPKRCQADPKFVAKHVEPWTPEFLESVDVSPPFVKFLDETCHMVMTEEK